MTWNIIEYCWCLKNAAPVKKNETLSENLWGFPCQLVHQILVEQPVYVTPKDLHGNGKSNIWRCISYWKWWFSIVMWIFGGGKTWFIIQLKPSTIYFTSMDVCKLQGTLHDHLEHLDPGKLSKRPSHHTNLHSQLHATIVWPYIGCTENHNWPSISPTPTSWWLKNKSTESSRLSHAGIL